MDFSLGYLKTRMGIPGPHFGFQLHRFGAGFPKGFPRQIMIASGFNRSPSIGTTIFRFFTIFIFYCIGKTVCLPAFTCDKKSKRFGSSFLQSTLINFCSSVIESLIRIGKAPNTYNTIIVYKIYKNIR